MSNLRPDEHITYANVEFERLTGLAAVDLEDKPWSALPGAATRDGRARVEIETAPGEGMRVTAWFSREDALR